MSSNANNASEMSPELGTGSGDADSQSHRYRTRQNTGQRNTENTIPTDVGHDINDPTLGIQPVQRIKWSNEMNKHIMRCYYISTNMEQDLTHYGHRLRDLFVEKYPQYQHRITVQNACDRRRAILRRKLLSDTELNELKNEILNLTDNNQFADHLTPDGTTPIEPDQQISHQDINSANTTEDSQEEQPVIDNTFNHFEFQVLKANFESSVVEFKGTSPLHRPTIPKIFNVKSVERNINYLNQFLIPNELINITSIEELHCLIYSSAITIIRTAGIKMYTSNTIRTKRIPPWQRRLNTKIENLRSDIGRLTSYLNGNRSNKIAKKVEEIIKPLRISDTTMASLLELKDTKQQKLAALAKRLRRYTECNERRQSNTLFKNNEKQFYKQLSKKEGVEGEANVPSYEDVRNFWDPIWGTPKNHNEEASWLHVEQMKHEDTPVMMDLPVTEKEIAGAIKVSGNFKAPGPDRIQNIWLKKFTSTHKQMAKYFNSILNSELNIPDFLLKGNTYLLHKTGDTRNPANYRPITCLSTMYKLFTKILANRIYEHCEAHQIIYEEQKGCSKNTKGCKDQLIIDSVTVQQAIKKKRNLSMAFIDYKKAFDSIPHSLMLKVLEIYKVHPKIVDFLTSIIPKWNINLYCGQKSFGVINIRSGIFQGDSLSPLWFCLALNPLSTILKGYNIGFEIKTPSYKTNITHRLFVDDLKLYASSKDKLFRLLKSVQDFSSDIAIQWGVDKCKIIHIKRGTIQTTEEEYTIKDDEIMEQLVDDPYKYLGFAQLKGIRHSNIKQKLTSEFTSRLKSICKSHLNSGNKIKAINTYAIPVFTFSFGIINWSKTDIDEIERKLRTTLTKYKSHHPKSATERIFIKRKNGGRGVLSINQLLLNQVQSLREYFRNSTSLICKTIVEADINYTPLKLTLDNQDSNENFEETLKNDWLGKALHGTHPNELKQPHLNEEVSNAWLTRGQLFSETEGFFMAIQDRVIATKNYRKVILKENMSNDLCRKCARSSETIEHVIGGCQNLANHDYLKRHNNVSKIIHQELAKKFGLVDENLPYYKYQPQAVLENDTAKIYWDRSIITDQRIEANRPDIVVFEKTTNKITIFDVAIPLSNNIQSTYNTKIEKYRNLAEELREMYRAESVKICPFILSATALIPNHLLTNLEEHGIKSSIYEIQKAVVLDTCRIVRLFLN